jgi:hypothetical protein
MSDIATAILAIKSDAQVSINGEDIDNIIWHDSNPTGITKDQIIAKQAELKTAYDALAYARARSLAYPGWQEFAEAYCEKEIGEDSTKWDAYVTAYNKVRSDNSKG